MTTETAPATQATASTSGYRATASTSGYQASASTSGHRALASTSGYRAIAICADNGWARAGVGGVIALGHFDGFRQRLLVAYPGETEGIPPNVWCRVVDGAIVADLDLLIGCDSRGYMLRHENGRYLAGCRDFTAAEAIAHWSDPDHESPADAALLKAAVEAHVASLAAVPK